LKELNVFNFLKRHRVLILAFSVVSIWATILFAQSMAQGPYGVFFRQTTAIDTGTLGTGQSFGLLVGTPTAAATYTTPTATRMCAAFPSVAIAPPASNFAVQWDIKNTSAGANTITLAGGTGVTVSGTGTVAQNHIRHFIWVPGSCGVTPAWTLFSAQDSAF
jgi:hypothetical protein